MKKIYFLAFFLALQTFCFASVDVELPLDMSLFKTEIPFDAHQSYGEFFPYFSAGPVRALYVFDDFPQNSNWNFALGGGVFVWPFQVLAASARAEYKIFTFENQSFFTVSGTLDAGALFLFTGYYDVENGKTVNKLYASPAVGTSLELRYHFPGEKHFYTGGGFFVGGSNVSNSLFVLYGITALAGFRF